MVLDEDFSNDWFRQPARINTIRGKTILAIKNI